MHEDSQRFQGNVLPVSDFAKIVCKNEKNKKQIKKRYCDYLLSDRKRIIAFNPFTLVQCMVSVCQRLRGNEE